MEELGSQKLLYHGPHGIFIVMTFVDSSIPIKLSSIIRNLLSTNLYISSMQYLKNQVQKDGA